MMQHLCAKIYLITITYFSALVLSALLRWIGQNVHLGQQVSDKRRSCHKVKQNQLGETPAVPSVTSRDVDAIRRPLRDINPDLLHKEALKKRGCQMI